MNAAPSSAVVSVLSPAKLNLTFELKGCRADGYHEVRTLLQSIDLEDRLTVSLSDDGSGGIRYRSYRAEVEGDFPEDDSNLISKAIKLYAAAVPAVAERTVIVDVEKRIPIGSGMAGGRAAAAAALTALNQLCPGALSREELLALGARLGADVPFSIRGGTCLGTGRGDELAPLVAKVKLWFAIFKPRRLSISTPWAFRTYDQLAERARTAGAANKSESLEKTERAERADRTDDAMAALERGDLAKLADSLTNDLEPVVLSHYPALADLRKTLAGSGCLAARMTGSGPTIYALASGESEARAIAGDIMNRQESGSGEAPWLQDERVGKLDVWVAASTAGGARLEQRENAG